MTILPVTGVRMQKVSREILKTYFPADTILKLNDRDPNLTPIDVPLPIPPPLSQIEGYGLLAKDQKWKKPIIPTALQKIIRTCDTQEQFWDKLYISQHELKEEIRWLKAQWWHRRNGYWFFNNGKPTWITGTHYFYLTFFNLDIGSPKYRARSRKHFIAMDFIHSYTYDFKEKIIGKDGVRVPNKYGDELEDLGYRTMFGIVFPKMRRSGASYESLAWCLNRITMASGRHTGIQGPDETHGRRAFKKLVWAWRKLPLFFQPMYTGDNDPEAKLNFINKSTGDANAELGLESQVTYATTSNGLYYDQEKLLDYLKEEPGKNVKNDVYQDWDKIKQTLAQGDGSEIVGFSLYPSTVGEMEKGGGENYFYLCRDSNYYERLNSGQTKTGMVLIFIPADEGLEGYIDEYGESILDTPTPEQAKFSKKKVGSTEYLRGQREHYLQLGTPEAIEKYREHMRLYPLTLKECFTFMGGNAGFNELILDKRIAELRFDTDVSRRGNFYWTNGFKSKVDFRDDPHGRWVVSKLLPEGKNNPWYTKDKLFYPLHPRGAMHCADPFNFDETEHARQSKGGGLCIERKDPTEKETDLKKTKTPDLVCHYSYRHPDTTKFCEDMLMQWMYYGGKMNPEVNNEMVRKYFIQHGFRHALYFYKEEDGTYRKTAGYNLTGEMGNKILGTAVDFVELYGFRCNHIEVLNQCKELRGRKDITNKDLVAVLGGATHAIDNDFRVETPEDEEKETWDLSSWIHNA